MLNVMVYMILLFVLVGIGVDVLVGVVILCEVGVLFDRVLFDLVLLRIIVFGVLELVYLVSVSVTYIVVF